MLPRSGAILIQAGADGAVGGLGFIDLVAVIAIAAVFTVRFIAPGHTAPALGDFLAIFPITHQFADYSSAVYYAFIRQIGAGTVAAGGIITLIKTIPTIVKSVKGSVASLKNESGENASTVLRTDKD